MMSFKNHVQEMLAVMRHTPNFPESEPGTQVIAHFHSKVLLFVMFMRMARFTEVLVGAYDRIYGTAYPFFSAEKITK